MKTTTRETYLESVYRVILYIEQHYKEALTLEELARVAGFSKYHFHRIFLSITGESLSGYVRRVRLANATLKLKINDRITAVALDSGYETNASFSKAFKQQYGITPRAFAEKEKIKKGSTMMTPEMVTLAPIEVLYVRKEGAYMKSAAEAWQVLMRFAYEQKIKQGKELMGESAMTFGIAHDNPTITEEDKIRFDACISWDDPTVQPQGEVQAKTIEGGEYAVFLHEGAYENLGTTYDTIGDWIIESGVELRDASKFEKYLNRDPRRTKPENLRTEIYLPIMTGGK